jgi:hypothetical protein
MSHPKLKGQRLGQVVWGAIASTHPPNTGEKRNNFVAQNLYYIEDEDLVKLINDYLKER